MQMRNQFLLHVTIEHLKTRVTDVLPYGLSLALAFFGPNASAEEAIPGRVGGAAGTIIVNQGLEELKRQVADARRAVFRQAAPFAKPLEEESTTTRPTTPYAEPVASST